MLITGETQCGIMGTLHYLCNFSQCLLKETSNILIVQGGGFGYRLDVGVGKEWSWRRCLLFGLGNWESRGALGWAGNTEWAGGKFKFKRFVMGAWNRYVWFELDRETWGKMMASLGWVHHVRGVGEPFWWPVHSLFLSEYPDLIGVSTLPHATMGGSPLLDFKGKPWLA